MNNSYAFQQIGTLKMIGAIYLFSLVGGILFLFFTMYMFVSLSQDVSIANAAPGLIFVAMCALIAWGAQRQVRVWRHILLTVSAENALITVRTIVTKKKVFAASAVSFSLMDVQWPRKQRIWRGFFLTCPYVLAISLNGETFYWVAATEKDIVDIKTELATLSGQQLGAPANAG